MGKKARFFVDLDNTLISGDVDDVNNRVVVYRRPGAEKFLTTLRTLGDVILLTHGVKEHAREALRVTGLGQFFKFSITREDLDRVTPVTGKPIAPPGIMFDDYPVGSWLYDLKATAIGTYGHHDLWIQVERFGFDKPDRDGLKKALIELKRRIAS